MKAGNFKTQGNVGHKKHAQPTTSLPMADAIVYATAVEQGCKVVTGDAHFKHLEMAVFVS